MRGRSLYKVKLMFIVFLLFALTMTSCFVNSTDNFKIDMKESFQEEPVTINIEGPAETPFSLTLLNQLDQKIFYRTGYTDASGSYYLSLSLDNGSYVLILRSGSVVRSKEFVVGEFKNNSSPLDSNTQPERETSPAAPSEPNQPVNYLKTDTKTPLKIIHNSASETNCVNGKCTLTLHAGSMYTREDDRWKPIKEAKSLKNAWKKEYLSDDRKNYDIILNDFNYTYLEGTLWVKKKTKHPFKVCFTPDRCVSYNINFTRNEYNFSIDFAKNRTVIEGKEVNLADFSGLNPLSVHSWTLGAASTTIQLQDADTENLEDVTLAFMATKLEIGDCYTYIKFNISALPSNQIIEDAKLAFYYYSGEGGDDDVRFYLVENQTWEEDDSVESIWALSTSNQTTENFKWFLEGWDNVNVTDMVSYE